MATAKKMVIFMLFIHTDIVIVTARDSTAAVTLIS